jgi:hypothetical protein
MYVQYFDSHEDSATVVDLGTTSSNLGGEDGARELWNRSDDLGVTQWQGCTDKELDLLFGYSDGRPALFSRYRFKSGITAWDPPFLRDFDHPGTSLPEGAMELQPMWHQKVGLAALAESFWTEKEQDVPGVLLSDKVGLGKTVQVMTFIALIIDVYMAEAMSADGSLCRRPPILGESQRSESSDEFTIKCKIRKETAFLWARARSKQRSSHRRPQQPC